MKKNIKKKYDQQNKHTDNDDDYATPSTSTGVRHHMLQDNRTNNRPAISSIHHDSPSASPFPEIFSPATISPSHSPFTSSMSLGNLAISPLNRVNPFAPSSSGINDITLTRHFHYAYSKRTDPKPIDYHGMASSCGSMLDQRENDCGGQADKIKREQKCQRCYNHGKRTAVKGHKHFCKYRDCECPQCLATTRKQQSLKQQKLISKQASPMGEPTPNDSDERHIEQDYHGLAEMDRDLGNILDYDLYNRIDTEIKKRNK